MSDDDDDDALRKAAESNARIEENMKRMGEAAKLIADAGRQIGLLALGIDILRDIKRDTAEARQSLAELTDEERALADQILAERAKKP